MLYKDASEFKNAVDSVLLDIHNLLVKKNNKYGPVEDFSVFSRLPAEEALKVRIDDKLRRIRNLTKDDEDTLLDLIGYLVLLYVSRTAIRNTETSSSVSL